MLKKDDDVSWFSVAEFYIGKSYFALRKEDLAINQFIKVDSIFKHTAFVFPELQDNYEILIRHYHQNNNNQKEFACTKDLLKVDSILIKDFPYLSLKIYKDYDSQIVMLVKNKTERQNRWGLLIIFILITIVMILSYGILKYYQNEKFIRYKYKELEEKLLRQSKAKGSSFENIPFQVKTTISPAIFADIQQKLKAFEENMDFTENGITIEKLADNFDTNKFYLSQYINDTRGVNFSKYLSMLRINYITQLIYDDPKYLRLNIQGLADECGISSRTNFSNLFQEFNGIRPADFIKKRRKELEERKFSTFELHKK